jgi:hypothetical protein
MVKRGYGKKEWRGYAKTKKIRKRNNSEPASSLGAVRSSDVAVASSLLPVFLYVSAET